MTDPHFVLDALAARCEERRSPCGSGEMVWRIWGAGNGDRPPVVLLHGGFGAWNHWVRTVPALEPSFQVIAADLPGCGDSADPPEPYDADSLAALLSDGIDAILPGDAPFDLVGFSFGGVLSGRIAHAQAHRLGTLVIVGTPVLGLTRRGPANELVAVPADASPAQAAPVYRRNLEKLMVHDPRAVDDLAMALHLENMAKARLRSRGIARKTVTADSLRGLACRLAFVFGAHDATLDPDIAGIRDYVRRNHPDAAFHVIAGAGHWVQYEAADAFNALLPDLLAANGGATGR
jgi:pimeloyl-ACP methyl ester carboxylesterase